MRKNRESGFTTSICNPQAKSEMTLLYILLFIFYIHLYSIYSILFYLLYFIAFFTTTIYPLTYSMQSLR